MDLAKLIQQVLDLVVKVRAAASWKDYIALVPAVWEIVKEIRDALAAAPSPTPVMMASPAKQQALADGASKSIDDLCNDLEACCQANSGASGPMLAPNPHPIIDKLLPILIALLAKLIGI